MKKRNAAIGGFLLLAVGVIGVGFAAIPDELKVNGTVNASNVAVDVDFVDGYTITSIPEDTKDDEIDLSSDDILTATINSLDKVGDKAVITFKLVNNDENGTNWTAKCLFNATIEDSVDSINYFSVVDTFPDEGIELAKGATSEAYTITVTCDHLPTSDAVTATLTGTITATAVANNL